jgi:peptide/nickel transport system ATP-binding protein
VIATETVLASVERLTVDFWTGSAWANVVDDVSFELRPGESYGLVGESGCGKTTTAAALLGFRRPGSRVRAGAVRFGERDLLELGERELRQVRGREVALVPQNPTTSLTPNMRIGEQIAEAMRVHGVGKSGRQRRDRVLELIRDVRLPDAAGTARKYPHQLSGGQQQRVTIAIALACGPSLLVLDEPTTGLDVTTQAQILDLLARLRAEHGTAMLYVTHNLGVVAEICDRVGVMYAGDLVEEAPTQELFARPRHPYTRGLIASVPSIVRPERTKAVLHGLLQRGELPPGCRFAPRCPFADARSRSERPVLEQVEQGHRVACWHWRDIPSLEEQAPGEEAIQPAATGTEGDELLSVRGLDVAYTRVRQQPLARRVPVPVVRQVSFDIRPGETFALVGESGSGKSTIAGAVAGMRRPLAGEITFDGQNIARTVESRDPKLRREIQLVFQNPDASLNPRQRVVGIVGRPLELFFGLRGKALRQKVIGLLEDVRLDPSFARRYPHELSGGERQRVAIARALAAEPRLMLCDEVLSALDVSVQATILELLRTLQEERGIAYLFISHDLAVVRSLAHRVGVLYRGELCEVGVVEEVYAPPFHPYTEELLRAVPEADPAARRTQSTRVDSELGPMLAATACPFADRCPVKLGEVCEHEMPPWRFASETHAIRCHIPLDERQGSMLDGGVARRDGGAL